MKRARLYVAYVFAFVLFAFLFWRNKIPWDPCAYMLTGKHLLGGYTYYEALRAPVASLLYGVFGIYGFFIVSAALLACAVYVYSRKEGVRPLLLLTLLLPALSWPYYVEGGSEILALAFLLIGAAYSERPWAGQVFSLVFLSRYIYAFFVPFFLPWRTYAKNPRLALAHLVGFLAPVLLWSAVQWAVYGHPFASYIDFAYVNAHSPGTAIKPPRFDQLLGATLPTTALALPGLDLWALLFALVAIYTAVYPATPWYRFYLPLLIPLSVAAARWIKNERFAVVLALANVLLAFFVVYPAHSWDNAGIYTSMVRAMGGNCVYVSNVWVPLVCAGAYALPPSAVESLQGGYFGALERGYRAAVLLGVGHPPYMEDVNAYREKGIPLEHHGRFFLAGNGCIPPEGVWDGPKNPWQFYSGRLQEIMKRWLSSLQSEAPNPFTALNRFARSSET